METGYDKEIDALLRDRGLRTITTAERSLTGDHLDADALAGFAENALPANTRLFYMKHLADCDDCRSTLSGIIMLNAETAAEMPVAAAVTTPVAADAAMPWYRRLFLAPNLAYMMGGLLLVFGGLIGFTVLQNMQSDTVASIKGEDSANTAAARGPMASEPSTMSDEMPYAANTTANAANATDSAGNIPMPYATPASPTASSNAASTAERHEVSQENSAIMERAMPPPPPPAAAAPLPRAEEIVPADDAEKQRADLDGRQRRSTPIAGETAKTPAGPDRGLQRDNRSTGDAAAPKQAPGKLGATGSATRRTVDGKTFEQRDAVWYDTAYKGGETTNVRRRTDAYRKLDSGLRSITDKLTGTVVVVWKEKAYRID